MLENMIIARSCVSKVNIYIYILILEISAAVCTSGNKIRFYKYNRDVCMFAVGAHLVVK